ncbi:hypothetical protein H5410_005756 [Solanum commersonii]|uniref:Uncharacterized protein n=1 Tax=Solanum commersonii TaxID=4109 RepID=A0A9J6A8B6_SOLCO|nr:hypothetical protein H5410_005756 [Solanum commersonii]
MSSQPKVWISIYWDGEIIHDENTSENTLLHFYHKDKVPNDYVDQIKLTILEIYVRKEPKISQQRSPLSVNVHPRLENYNSFDGFPITQSTDFPNMTHYQNILIGRYDFDLNENINESERKRGILLQVME